MELMSLESIQDLVLDDAEFQELSNKYAALEGYYDQIASTGQISRAQAMALVNDCGIRFDHVPMSMFTTFPTTANHGVAMEGMVDTAMKLIVDLVKKAVDLLIKVSEWMVQAVRRRRERDRQAGKVCRNLLVLKHANDQLQQLGVDTTVVPDAAEHQLQPLEQRLDAAMNAYYQGFNAVTLDVLRNGNFSAGSRALNQIFAHYAEVTVNKINLFDHVLRAHPRAGHEDSGLMATLAQLRTVATPYMPPMLQGILQTLPGYQAGGRVKDQMDFITSSLRSLRTQPVDEDETISPTSACIYLGDNKSAARLPYRLNPDVQDKLLSELRSDLQRLRQIQPSNEASDEQRALFREAINEIQQEVMVLEAIVHFTEILSMEYDSMLNRTLAVYIHSSNLRKAKVNMITDKETRDAADKVQAEMRQALH